jgi:hypothetical protein
MSAACRRISRPSFIWSLPNLRAKIITQTLTHTHKSERASSLYSQHARSSLSISCSRLVAPETERRLSFVGRSQFGERGESQKDALIRLLGSDELSITRQSGKQQRRQRQHRQRHGKQASLGTGQRAGAGQSPAAEPSGQLTTGGASSASSPVDILAPAFSHIKLSLWLVRSAPSPWPQANVSIHSFK